MTNQPYVDRIEERTNSATGEIFHAAIFAQLLPVTSTNGNVSIRQVEVSVPITGGDSAVAKMRQAASVKMAFPGAIVRESCAPYTWVRPSDGASVTLSHTYNYRPDGVHSVAPVSAVPEVFTAPQPQFDVAETE